MLGSDQVHRIYLDELGDYRTLPLGVALMVLTIIKEAQTPEAARYLLERSQQDGSNSPTSRVIMELVTTIVVYKFETLSRREVEAMLGLNLQETRVYREAKDEGRHEEGRSLILRQLTRQVGVVPDVMRSQIAALSLEQIESLGEALLDFNNVVDLENWLAEHIKK